MRRTEDYISLERKELLEAIYAGDCDFVAEAMEAFGFKKDGAPEQYTESMRDLAFCTLAIAAAADSEDALTEATAFSIISYTASVVDIFGFINPIVNGAYKCQYNKLSKIPKGLKKSLLANEFDDSVAEAISPLSKAEFSVLIGYIASEVHCLSAEFAPAIIKEAYKHALPSPCLVFSFMLSALKKPIPDLLREILGL